MTRGGLFVIDDEVKEVFLEFLVLPLTLSCASSQVFRYPFPINVSLVVYIHLRKLEQFVLFILCPSLVLRLRRDVRIKTVRLTRA